MIYLKGESWQKHVLQSTPNRSLETIPRYLLLYSFSTLLHKAFEIKEFIHSLNSQMKFAKQKRAKTWQFQKKKKNKKKKTSTSSTHGPSYQTHRSGFFNTFFNSFIILTYIEIKRTQVR